MPGLNPLQNSVPKQQIPNEAPQYFNPFFEQPAKLPPVTIWQPPHIEKPPRSKAPTQRQRNPPNIPTAGTWWRKSSNGDTEKQEPKGLFQPKQKQSVDEMMWLGSVTGFELKEQKSLRSKLVRKPEEIPSQASALTGPKATEDRRKKEEEEKARQQRLQEWSKKKPQTATKSKRSGDATSSITPIPEPIESRLRPRKNIYTPVPQPAEVARISNRPNTIHRPFMPNHDDVGYAPENTFLPQPIETVRKSNRHLFQKAVSKVDEDEGTLWMGLPQPIETVRKSNRKSRLNKGSSIDNKKEEQKPIILPEPIETTRRSNRPSKAQTPVSLLPQPVETSRKSNRPEKKEILPAPIETTRKSNRPQTEILPEPIETTRRSNRQPEPADKPNEAKQAETLMDLNEPKKSPNRPNPTPIQRTDKSSILIPTTSFFCPDTLPQPIESSRRSHRPLARPLVPQLVETSMRSNRIRVPASELHHELPQPISVSRWSNRSPGPCNPRRENSQPMSPGLYAPPLHRDRSKKLQFNTSPATDHVWHLHEPIDSVPTSPAGSPDASPSASKCPSLSSSPTSSAASSAWGGPIKKRGMPRRRGSVEDGFSGYVLELDRSLKKEGACGITAIMNEGARDDAEYSFPITEKNLERTDQAGLRIGMGRSESSETVRPAPRTIRTESNIRIDMEPRLDKDTDDYPICHSPIFSNFKRPQLPVTPAPEDDDSKDKQQDNNSDIPTYDLGLSKTTGLVIPNPSQQHQLPTPPNSEHSSTSNKVPTAMIAPPRMWCPTGPSPGYTVASLPPTKRKESPIAKEITPEFVDEVYRYLSLQFDNIAVKFDGELSKYTGMTIEEVKADRKAALSKYCHHWVQENPEIVAGEASKGGLW